MADVKRWCVTYTKHVKQKRKVYHDGLLDLHSSSNKVLLYDDCEKLLDSRTLKSDEFVQPGESLAFDGFLIDIGDPQGEKKPLPDQNFLGRVKSTAAEASWSVQDSKLGNSSGKRKGLLSPSFSQRCIKEFKKSALRNYQGSLNSPDSTKSSAEEEWHVLFTTHITQKAKKYHDGILQLVGSGSQRKVMLYDIARKLVDSRFLKKDEIIKSGQSLTFDAHLVDIGEPKQKHESIEDLSTARSNCKKVEQAEIQHGQQILKANNPFVREFKKSARQNYQGPLGGADSNIREWQVLYTTHITQKAKKYHDGFLRLTISRSHGRQVMLYDTDRKLLESKFLKKDEIIKSGLSLAFDAHLVDIGEPERSSLVDLDVQQSSCRKALETEVLHGEHALTKASIAVLTEKPQNHAHPKKDSGSSFSNSLADKVDLGKPLRDASEILSILKKPVVQDSITHIAKANMEQFDHKDQMLQLEHDSTNFGRAVVENCEYESEAPDERPIKQHPYKNAGNYHEAHQQESAPPSNDGSKGSASHGHCPQQSSSPSISSSCGAPFKGFETGNFYKPDADLETESSCPNKTFASEVSSITTPHGTTIERECSEELKKVADTDECPSFELGF